MEVKFWHYSSPKPVDESLFDAVKEHDVEKAMNIVAQGANVNSTDMHGDTPLLLAVENVDLQLIDLFLRQQEVDVNVRNTFGDTPLSTAVYLKQLKLVKLLLEAGGRVNDMQPSGKYLIHEATFQRHIELVKLLINHGAEVNVFDSFGRTPLQIAVLSRPFPRLAALLLHHGANVNLPNNQGLTLLLEACLSARTPKETATVKMLIANGAEVNYREPYAGRTALHMAIINGNYSLVQLLVNSGADPTALCHGIYPPHRLATIHGFENISKYLRPTATEAKRVRRSRRTSLTRLA